MGRGRRGTPEAAVAVATDRQPFRKGGSPQESCRIDGQVPFPEVRRVSYTLVSDRAPSALLRDSTSRSVGCVLIAGGYGSVGGSQK